MTPATGRPIPIKGPGACRGGRAIAKAGSIIANKPEAAPADTAAHNAHPPRTLMVTPKLHKKELCACEESIANPGCPYQFRHLGDQILRRV